jgi:hypothetical protein
MSNLLPFATAKDQRPLRRTDFPVCPRFAQNSKKAGIARNSNLSPGIPICHPERQPVVWNSNCRLELQLLAWNSNLSPGIPNLPGTPTSRLELQPVARNSNFSRGTPTCRLEFQLIAWNANLSPGTPTVAWNANGVRKFQPRVGACDNPGNKPLEALQR